MRFRLRTLMLAVFMVCLAASFHERIQVWWWSHTRPEVTFVGNMFDERELASVAGVPLFAELTLQQSSDATNEIVRTYRMMGYVKARISVEKTNTNRRRATRFVVNEGPRYNADEVSEIVANSVMDQSCARHGRYLCVSPDGKTAATTPRPCPICDRTMR